MSLRIFNTIVWAIAIALVFSGHFIALQMVQQIYDGSFLWASHMPTVAAGMGWLAAVMVLYGAYLITQGPEDMS
jgi:hypothetical protein